MSGKDDDDLPDYLKGVEAPSGFNERDNVTLRPDREGSLDRKATSSKQPVDEDDDDDDEPREPFRFPIPPQVILLAVAVVIALGMLGTAGVFAAGTWVSDAQRAALASAGELARAVDEERKIIDELGSRGADRNKLLAMFAEIDSADGHARGAKALQFTKAVDHEIVAIGDVRGTSLDERQKKLSLAQSQYEAAMGSWRSAAGNPLGRLACGVGIAEAPP